MADEKTQKTPEKRSEQRATLLQLLLICLVLVGIVYLGLSAISVGLGLVVFVLAYFLGIG